jgi:integrase
MSQSKRFTWTEPALCHYSHDMKMSWFVYFDYTDHLTGKTARKQFRGGINKLKIKDDRIRAGNAFIKYWKEQLENGYNPFSEDDAVLKMPYHYTVSEAYDKILSIHLPSLGKRSKETYTYVVKYFKEWLIKKGYQNIPLKEFSNSFASDYLDSLISDRGYSGRTHNDHLLILKTLINRMIDREWILKSPFKKIPNKPTSTGRNIAYTDEEREALIKHLKEHDQEMYYFSQIMYYTFIRRSELARLKVKDFDLHNHTIIIPANVSKNKTQESVVIPVGLEPILKEMRLHKAKLDDYVFGRKLVRSPIVYSNVNHISTRHNKFLKVLDIDNQKGLYSHKHTGVIKAYYATGKDIYSVMRQLRHRDLNTTQIYLKSLGLIQNDVFRNAMIA